MINAYNIVEQFEQRVAEFAGAPYAIAVDCCTTAIQLCAEFVAPARVRIPARTYLSVPAAVLRASSQPLVILDTYLNWRGQYELSHTGIHDGAKRFRRDMFATAWTPLRHHGNFLTLSFHYKKHIPIGRGGMILTDNTIAHDWFKRMRYDGRPSLPYSATSLQLITELGYHAYMTPDQAARGMALMDVMPSDNLPDLEEDYPNLAICPALQNHPRVRMA